MSLKRPYANVSDGQPSSHSQKRSACEPLHPLPPPATTTTLYTSAPTLASAFASASNAAAAANATPLVHGTVGTNNVNLPCLSFPIGMRSISQPVQYLPAAPLTSVAPIASPARTLVAPAVAAAAAAATATTAMRTSMRPSLVCPYATPASVHQANGTPRTHLCFGECAIHKRTCVNKVLAGIQTGKLARADAADYFYQCYARQQELKQELTHLQARLVARTDDVTQATFRLDQVLQRGICGECRGQLTNDDIVPGAGVSVMHSRDQEERRIEFPLHDSRGRSRCVKCKVFVHHHIICSVIRDPSRPLERCCRTCYDRSQEAASAPSSSSSPSTSPPSFFPQRTHVPTTRQRQMWILEQQDFAERFALPPALCDSPTASNRIPLGAWDRPPKQR